jgi:hypothetical protein
MNDDADESDGETNSSSTRHPYTNDWIAGALVAFAIVTTFAYVWQGKKVPLWLATTDALAITTAVVWAFGRGAFSAAKDAVVGGGKGG